MTIDIIDNEYVEGFIRNNDYGKGFGTYRISSIETHLSNREIAKTYTLSEDGDYIYVKTKFDWKTDNDTYLWQKY